MKLHASIIIIVCCFLLQFSNLAQKRYIFSLGNIFNDIVIVCIQGLMFLIYPLLGHLADVYLTRYRTLKCGAGIIVTAGIIFISWFAIIHSHIVVGKDGKYAVGCLIIIGITIGIGLFEANAIQLGLDQLLEAPTSKLIAFIHWYYWSQNVGELVVFYIYYVGNFATFEACIMLVNFRIEATILQIAACLIIFLVAVAMLVFFCVSKKHFYIQRAGFNPFKNIYRVLKYAWKHKVPERRSAFTYWEEDIPPRIDLGKDKYGGPFTTEEVEDTKTFLRILPLLLCLFGYHLAGDGYSAPQQLQRTSCPSLPVLLLIVANPLHMSVLVTVVGIPLYRLVILKVIPRVKHFLMLTKMWLGLYLSLLQVVLYIIVVMNHNTTPWYQLSRWLLSYNSPIRACSIIRTGYLSIHTNSCIPNNEHIDNTYLWFIIPQFLNGLSSLLVSMTVFEFICAQAPHTTQGLLIGLWYATFSIRYLVVGVLELYITERRSWLICEGVKGFLILVSLVLFSCVSRHYHYRQRDEIVNIQAMIEDTHERWLDQEEKYMKEQRAFYKSFRVYI